MITSSRNPKIQQMRKLIASKKERNRTASFVVEGVRLAEEALQSSLPPHSILYSKDLSERGFALLDIALKKNIVVEEVESQLLHRVSDTKNSQGILLVCPFVNLTVPASWDFGLLLDGISDPGNLGTILRTALSFNVNVVFSLPNTTDYYAPKVVRAAMGAHYHLPYQVIQMNDVENLLQQKMNMQVLLTDVESGIPCWQVDLRKPTLLVIGNEAHGLQEDYKHLAKANIRIPMSGKTESLNAAIATSILCYETKRQRQI